MGSCISLSVTQREVIHSDIVTTLDAHLVVLSEDIVIQVFLPVSVVVIDGILVVVGIGVQELNLGTSEVAAVRNCTNQFRDVVAILLTIHDLHGLGGLFKATVGTNLDSSHHALAATGVDEHDAVGTFCTVESGTVLEDFNAFDVFGVDDVEDIVQEALVKRGAVILHVHDDTIDDDQRHGI